MALRAIGKIILSTSRVSPARPCKAYHAGKDNAPARKRNSAVVVQARSHVNLISAGRPGAYASEKGFTLIEVLLAMLLVFIVSVAVFQAYRTAMDASTRATTAMRNAGADSLLQAKVRMAVLAGQKEGEILLHGQRYQWQITQRGTRETTLGFDPESLALKYTGRHVSLVRIEVRSPSGDDSSSFEMLSKGK